VTDWRFIGVAQAASPGSKVRFPLLPEMLRPLANDRIGAKPEATNLQRELPISATSGPPRDRSEASANDPKQTLGINSAEFA